MRLERLPLSLLLLCCSFTLSAAQDATPARDSAPPVVTASARAELVRFAALGPVDRLRLEVYDRAGEAQLYDSGLRAGNVRDWPLVDRAGARLPDGAYVYVVTARDAAGRLSLKQGVLMLEGGAASVSLGESSPAGRVAQEESAAGGGAATLLTHDGAEGSVTSTQGALTLRTGDLLAGGDTEHVRVTEEGRVGVGTSAPETTLDVAGDIRASGFVRAAGGIRFSDGTTLDAAGGRLALTSAEGDPLPGPSAAGTGTQNRLAKWAETGGAGTLTDSLLSETGTTVRHHGNFFQMTGNSTAMVESNILHLDASNKTMGQIAGPGSFFGSANGPYFILRGNDYSAIAGQRGLAIFSGGSVASPVGREGSIQFNTLDQIRMLITPAGNVGIGLGFARPTSMLEVGGAVKFEGLRTESNATSPNVVGGDSSNTVTAGVAGATISGGGNRTLENDFSNRVTDNFGTVGGGSSNQAGDNTDLPTSATHATVGGGSGNTASGRQSTVSGGSGNTASGPLATVPGGAENEAAGTFSFAAGFRARALHEGTFVWADSTTDFFGFRSTAADQFLVRASGGVGIGTNAPAAQFHVKGASASAETPVAVVESSGGQAPLDLKSAGTGAARVRADGLGNLVLATTAGTSRDIFLRAGDDSSTDLFIDSATGHVGVGTTGPARPLHVNGRARVADIPPEASVGSVCFNAAGDLLQCGASSLRHKRDVAPLAGGLGVVTRLRPIAFTWRQGGARDVGLVAEEVARVAPQFAFGGGSGVVEGVRYDRLPVLLINAVQEQQRQIEQLRREVAALRRRRARASGHRHAPREGRRGTRPRGGSPNRR